jgi:MFS family permease
VLAAAVGFGMMICIMTATPIFLHKMSHFNLNDTAFILQSHIMAMFLPSLFTGSLIARFGPLKMIIAGLVSFLLTVMLAVSSTDMIAYWSALVLLGIGWNFLFITATVLLSQTYKHSERFKAQGINDFAIVLTQMAASFLAGALLFSSGWINLNLLMIPLILVTLTAFIVGRKYIAIQ